MAETYHKSESRVARILYLEVSTLSPIVGDILALVLSQIDVENIRLMTQMRSIMWLGYKSFTPDIDCRIGPAKVAPSVSFWP